jgi:ribosome-binding protein aMBF1 (putative translation factor)
MTAEQKARVEKVRAKRRSVVSRVEETGIREVIKLEYLETGSLKTAGDGTTMADLVVFRRFVMSLRKERERIGLSLNDVSERAKIDKAALSRLESGQQLNPTVGTLTRYARALGKNLTWGLADAE